MATKRRIRKKSIKEDRLVTYSLKVSQYAQEHFNQVLTGVVILLVALAALLYITHSRRAASQNSERYLGAALALYRQGDIGAAKTSFQNVNDMFSKTRAAVIGTYFLGECDLKLGNFTEAVASFDSYLDKSEKFPEFTVAATIGKAICLDSLGQFADAAATLEQLIGDLSQDDPRYAESLFRIGSSYKKAGETEKAIQYFTEVVEKGSGPLKEEAEVFLAALKAVRSRM